MRKVGQRRGRNVGGEADKGEHGGGVKEEGRAGRE